MDSSGGRGIDMQYEEAAARRAARQTQSRQPSTPEPTPGADVSAAANAAQQALAAAAAEGNAIARQVHADQQRLAEAQLELARAANREQQEIARREVAIAEQQLAMATDLWAYSKEFRPLEKQMLERQFAQTYGVLPAEEEYRTYMQMAVGPQPEYDTQIEDAAQRMYMDQMALYEQNRPYVEQMVGQSLADAQSGFSRSADQLQRAGLRYGMAPDAATFGMGELGLARAQTEAAVANTARQEALQDIRNRAAVEYDTALAARQDVRQRGLQGFDMTSQMEQLRTAEDARKWAQQMDVAGLGRNLVGSSQGAYGLAGQSLSSASAAGARGLAGVGQAAQLGMTPGQNYMSAFGQNAGLLGTGYQLQLGGLGNVLSADTSLQNAQLQAKTARQGQAMGMFGSILGAGLSFAATSDRRLKTDVEWVGRDERTGLPLYEFAYLTDPARRYRGVMADDVEKTVPEAVVTGDDGFKRVNYAMLGIEFQEVAA